MAKAKENAAVISIKAKCVGCQKIQELTTKQIEEAKRDGAAISTCCFMPMVVESAKYSKSKTKNK